MNVLKSNWFIIILSIVVVFVIVQQLMVADFNAGKVTKIVDSTWQAPSLFLDNTVKGEERALLIYGEDLIAHTSKYLGPSGSVMQISNGMNCQNCHLDAGTRNFGNNYSLVASTYPKFRERSGTVENLNKRVNDCFERSLNGVPLDTNSKEMKAITAYIQWLGKEIPKGTKPYGSGIPKLAYLDRPADPEKGKVVYNNYCQTCHGANGEGQLDIDQKTYATPPLWGNNSYNDGAGLYRLSNFAGFVKSNMPFNQASHADPRLTEEEAWDVAAYVNAQPRPHKDQSNDWPDVAKKPLDFPFGPYADTFSEKQHKYGPFKPIETDKMLRQNKALAQNTHK